MSSHVHKMQIKGSKEIRLNSILAEEVEIATAGPSNHLVTTAHGAKAVHLAVVNLKYTHLICRQSSHIPSSYNTVSKCLKAMNRSNLR